MRFDGIKEKVIRLISNRYNLDENTNFIDEMKSFINGNEITYNEIIRIKRKNAVINTYKTLIFIELSETEKTSYKELLREVVTWVALVRDRLIDTEIIDLYLFLALPDEIDKEECTRIEASDKLCRKYVLKPLEDIEQYLNRTFLQNMSISEVKAKNDPIINGFAETRKYYNWLNADIEKKWRDILLKYSSRELAEKIVNGDGEDVSK